MKGAHYLLLAFSLLTIFGFQCSKEEFEEVFTGKVVLEGICGRTVIQIVDGDRSQLPAGSYAPRWTNPSTGTAYENVFMIGNICQVETTLTTGSQFYFTLHEQPNNGCITCLAWSPAPEQQMAIKVVAQRPR